MLLEIETLKIFAVGSKLAMPIYEYQCESCEHIFEIQQKFSDPPVETCSKCGKSVRKLISAPGLMFKGTGWYVTDYSNKLKDPNLSKPSASAGEKQDSGASGVSGESGGGDSSSSDTKSDSSSTPPSSPSSSPASSPTTPPSTSSSTSPSSPKSSS